jgi:hypothetical protein
MMPDLVTELIEARRLITAEQWGTDNLEDLGDIARELAAEMLEATREATGGVPAALRSIVLKHAKHDNGDVEMIARWSPDATQGVALIGGPLDGGLIALPRHPNNGLPPAEFLGAQYIAKRGWMEKRITKKAIKTVEREGVLYVRAGIDPHFDRWVYRYAPEKLNN